MMEIEMDSTPYDFLFGDKDFTSVTVTTLTNKIKSKNSGSDNGTLHKRLNLNFHSPFI